MGYALLVSSLIRRRLSVEFSNLSFISKFVSVAAGLCDGVSQQMGLAEDRSPAPMPVAVVGRSAVAPTAAPSEGRRGWRHSMCSTPNIKKGLRRCSKTRGPARRPFPAISQSAPLLNNKF